MKLIVTRHAKSSWETDHRDHDRPLSSRGIKAAGKIGRWLDAKGYHPRIVLCSTAARTRLTWSYLSEHLPPPAQVRFISAMYGGMPGSMLGNLQEEADDPVIMIGHNPGLASFASNILAQRPESPDFFPFSNRGNACLRVGHYVLERLPFWHGQTG